MSLPDHFVSQIQRPHVLCEAVRRDDAGDIIVAARNSGSSGRVAAGLAVDDFIDAVVALKRDTGLDITDFVPPRDEMIAGLRATKPHKSTKDGKTFFNTFYTPVSAPGLHTIISTGSARKEDDDLVQPFVQFVCDAVLEHRAPLLFGRRADRVFRSDLPFADVLRVLRATKGYFGTEERFWDPENDGDCIHLMVTAQSSKNAAKTFAKSSRDGWRRNTSALMVDGRAQNGTSRQAPPGFARLRMAEELRVGASWFCLETPYCLPDPALVVSGYPGVCYEDGSVVDQVENVRWAIRQLADPRVSLQAIADGMVARRYSTDTLRKRVGNPCATWTALPRLLRPIVNNLDLYETGRLSVRLSITDERGRELDPIVTDECFPPDTGEWLPAQVFADARARLGGQIRRVPVLFSFAGLRVTVDGQQGYLRSRRRPRVIDGSLVEEPAYVVEGGAHAVVRAGAVIGHEELADAFGAAIELCAKTGAELLPPPVVSKEHALASRRTLVAHELAEVVIKKEAVLDQLASGQVEGRLLAELNRRFNDNLAPRAEELAIELGELDQVIESHTIVQERATRVADVRATEVLELVAATGDPLDHTFRDVLRHAVEGLHLNVEQVPVADGGQRMHLTGALRLGVGDASYAAPIDHSWTTLPVRCRYEEMVELIDSKGHVGALHGRRARSRYALLLSPATHQLLLWQVTDERIARTAFEVLDRGDESLDDVAARLGEPLRFVERIAEVHSPTASGNRRWLRGGNVVPTMYRLAAKQDGLVRYEQILSRGVQLSGEAVRGTLRAAGHHQDWTALRGVGLRTRPCHCGSWRRMPAAIPEPVGAVCGTCRRDAGGIEWPADPYDGFLLT